MSNKLKRMRAAVVAAEDAMAQITAWHDYCKEALAAGEIHMRIEIRPKCGEETVAGFTVAPMRIDHDYRYGLHRAEASGGDLGAEALQEIAAIAQALGASFIEALRAAIVPAESPNITAFSQLVARYIGKQDFDKLLQHVDQLRHLLGEDAASHFLTRMPYVMKEAQEFSGDYGEVLDAAEIQGRLMRAAFAGGTAAAQKTREALVDAIGEALLGEE